MNRKAALVLVGCAVAGLSACGGGDDDGASDGPVALAGTADALRELTLAAGANGAVASLVDLPGPGGALAARSSMRAKATESGPCEDGGSFSETTGQGPHDFVLLGIPAVTVDFSRGSANNCKSVSAEGNHTTTYIENGSGESGESVAPVNGASLSYESSADGFSEIIEERENGTLLHREVQTRQGKVEFRSTGSSDETRVLGSFRYSESGSDTDSYKARIDVGDSTAHPLRVVVTDTSLVIDGSYAYHTTDCSGGKVTVSTPSEGGVALDGNRRPVGGQLQLNSGSNTVLFSFGEDGGATVRFNGGAPTSLTPTQVHTALDAEDIC